MTSSEAGGLIAIIIILFIVFMGFFIWGYSKGQETGQVSCINGDIYYELVVEEDQTSNWEYIPMAARKGRE